MLNWISKQIRQYRTSQQFHGAQKRLDDASERVLHEIFMGHRSGRNNSVFVTPHNALKNPTVYNCIRIIVSTISTLPLKLIERDTHMEVKTHSTSSLLMNGPNPEQTTAEWLQMVLVNFLTWGNGYSEISRSARGQIIELVPFSASRTEVERKEGNLIYTYSARNGRTFRLTGDRVLHFRDIGLGELAGTSKIMLAEQAIALAMTQEQEQEQFFSKGLRPDFVVKFPPEKNAQFTNRVKESPDAVADKDPTKSGKHTLEDPRELVRRQILGDVPQNHRGLFIPEGYDLTPLDINYQQVQFLETRDFQNLEIARVFGVPPSKLGIRSKESKVANFEEEQRAFFGDTIIPIIKLLEQRLNKMLLSPAERLRFQFKFNTRAMLEGNVDVQTRRNVAYLQNGALTINEVRAQDDLPPVEGGDVVRVPLNMTSEQSPFSQAGDLDRGTEAERGLSLRYVEMPLKALPEPQERQKALPEDQEPRRDAENGGNQHSKRAYTLSEAQKRSLDNRRKTSRNTRSLIQDVVSQIIRKEKRLVLKDAKSLLNQRNVVSLQDRIQQIYTEEIEPFVLERANIPFRTILAQVSDDIREELGEEFSEEQIETLLRDYVEIFTRDYVRSSVNQLSDVLTTAQDADEDLLGALTNRFDEWENGIEIAEGERNPSRAEKAALQESYNSVNVFSRGLFVLAGVQVLRWVAFGKNCPRCDELDGKTWSITRPIVEAGSLLAGEQVKRSVKNPPLHSGCDCSIVAG